MAPARTFVSFSSTDIGHYQMMRAWKAHEHNDFNFADFQLDDAVRSENESYVKQICRQQIQQAGTFVLLIGNDTFSKTTFVRWEVEVAIEKGCRLVGVNLNNCRRRDWLCPYFFVGYGALFVPFSSRIVAEALQPWHRDPQPPGHAGDFYFYDHVYARLGYELVGDTAVIGGPAS